MRPNHTFKHLREQGFKFFRRDTVIWAKQMDMPFDIHTPEGILQGEAGDYWCVAPGNRRWSMNAARSNERAGLCRQALMRSEVPKDGPARRYSAISM